MDSILFQGTERWTLEMEGRLSAARARALVGPRCEVVADGEQRARVSLVLFCVENLRFTWFPFVGITYGEALWRVAARCAGEDVWVAARCDLDSAVARLGDGAFIGYPDRSARFEVEDSADALGISVITRQGTLAVSAQGLGAPLPQAPPQKLMISRPPRLIRVPWEEVPAPSCQAATTRVQADDLSGPTFGDSVQWSPEARLLRGRIHRCGRSIET